MLTELEFNNSQARFNYNGYGDYVNQIKSQEPKINLGQTINDGITGANNYIKDKFTGFKEGVGNFKNTIGDGIKGILDNTLIGRFAAMNDATNSNAFNYNPDLQGQIDFMKNQGMYGNNYSSSLPQIQGGVLDGQNLQSLFGANDLETMYDNKISGYDKTIARIPNQFSKSGQEEIDRKIKVFRKRKNEAIAERGLALANQERINAGGRANEINNARTTIDNSRYMTLDQLQDPGPNNSYQNAIDRTASRVDSGGNMKAYGLKKGGRVGYFFGGRVNYKVGGVVHPDGRKGFFKGALADTAEGKAMSPGTDALGDFRGGDNDGGNNNNSPSIFYDNGIQVITDQSKLGLKYPTGLTKNLGVGQLTAILNARKSLEEEKPEFMIKYDSSLGPINTRTTYDTTTSPEVNANYIRDNFDVGVNSRTGLSGGYSKEIGPGTFTLGGNLRTDGTYDTEGKYVISYANGGLAGLL